MIWQDAVFFVGTAIFVLALLPTVLGPNKPSQLTSIITGAILVLFALTYTTLGFWYSSSVAALNACLWFILFFQSRAIDRSK